MKKMIVCLFLTPLLSSGQVQIVKKPVTIADVGPLAWSQTLQRSVNDNDTSYTFYFRNTSYQSIVDMKSFKLTKAELKEFGKGLTAVLTSNFDEQVWIGHTSLSKIKGAFGETKFQIYFDHGFGSMKEKHVNKLIEAINHE